MARPARTPVPPTPRRGLVRNISGTPSAVPAAAPEVILEARPAIDFLVSMMLDTDSELLPADRAWYDESRASLSDALRRDLARVLGDEQHGKGIGAAIVPLAVEDPTVRSSADVVALAGRLAARDLLGASGDHEELREAVAISGRVTGRRTRAAGRGRGPVARGVPRRDRPSPRRSRWRAAGAPPRAPRLARALRADRGPSRPHGGARRGRPPGRPRPPTPRRLRRAGRQVACAGSPTRARDAST